MINWRVKRGFGLLTACWALDAAVGGWMVLGGQPLDATIWVVHVASFVGVTVFGSAVPFFRAALTVDLREPISGRALSLRDRLTGRRFPRLIATLFWLVVDAYILTLPGGATWGEKAALLAVPTAIAWCPWPPRLGRAIVWFLTALVFATALVVVPVLFVAIIEHRPAGQFAAAALVLVLLTLHAKCVVYRRDDLGKGIAIGGE